MAILNIKAARKWLGELLQRSGPITPRTWRGMVDQGLPIGLIGGAPFVSTEAVEAWLEARAGLPLSHSPMPIQVTRPSNVATQRRVGRPKKQPL